MPFNQRVVLVVAMMLLLVSAIDCFVAKPSVKLSVSPREAKLQAIRGVRSHVRAVMMRTKTARRRFGSAQEETQCPEVTNFTNDCETWISQAGELHPSVCENECRTRFLALPSTCFGEGDEAKGIAAFKDLIDFQCSDDGNGGFCGETLYYGFQGFANCSNHETQSQCTSDNKCQFDEREGCQRKINADSLNTICSPCLGRALALTHKDDSQLDLSPAALERFQSLLCSKVDNTYCFVELQSFFNSSESEGIPTGDALTDFCGSRVRKACYRRILPVIFEPMVDAAVANARRCAAEVDPELSNREEVVRARCQTCFQNDLAPVRIFEFVLSNLCLKNPDGHFCLSSFGNDSNSEALESCGEQIFGEHECNATCNTAIETFVDDLGCCLGVANHLVKLPSQELSDDEERLFEHAIAEEAPGADRRRRSLLQEEETPNVDVPVEEPEGSLCSAITVPFNFSALGACASQEDIDTKLEAICQAARGQEVVRRTLKLKLKCSVVEALSDADQAALEGKIATDIAFNVGLDRNSIVTTFPALACATSASMRRKLLQSSDAMNFNFGIQGESDEESNAAADRFNSLVASNALVLPATTAELEATCPDCVDNIGDLYSTEVSGASHAVLALVTVLVSMIALF